MSQRALIEQVRKDFGLTTADATAAVENVFISLRRVLEEDRNVTIPGFGTFRRKFRDTTNRRNPRTGEPVVVTAHHAITFKEAKPKR